MKEKIPRSDRTPRLYIVNLQQCDKKRCTGHRLIRFGMAKELRHLKEIPSKSVLLNPFSQQVLSPIDDIEAIEHGLVAIDGSWKRINWLKQKDVRRCRNKALPLLIAANPINYGKPTTLSTAESLSAAMYIMKFKDEGLRILSKFKWGPEFIKINRNRLNEYANCKTTKEILEKQGYYMRQLGYKVL